MNVYRSKVFRAGNSDAVRLPKELTPGTNVEVEIEKIGDSLTIRPAQKAFDGAKLVEALRAIGKPEGPPLKREKIIFPKRKGLY